jgi:Holliday junction resolvase RusA-like endonuclease
MKRGDLMQTVSFCVYGKVRGQGRPRFTGKKRRKGKKTAYEKPEDTAYKKAIAKAYRERANGAIFHGEVSISIYVFRKMPIAYKGNAESDIYRPDVDNIAKAVMDALNGVAYDDDKQVTRLYVTKAPREKQRKREHIRVYIRAVDNGNID